MTASNQTSADSKLTWQAEETHPDVIDSVREKLREVVDPEIGLNVIELGLIRDLLIEDDNVLVTMILTTPFCPYAPALMEMVRKKTQEALIREDVIVELGMEMWDPTMMEEGAGADWGLF